MTQLIRAFIIMQETSLKINRDLETTVAVSVAHAELPKSRVILSMFQRANVTERAQVVIYSNEGSMVSGNGNRDSLNPVASPSVVEKVSNVLVPQILRS